LETFLGAWNLEHSFNQLSPVFFDEIEHLRPVAKPSVVAFNQQLAIELGLPTQIEAAVLCGSELPPGARPIAMAYAGHQFGHLAMLGDGRACLLGEQITPEGRRFDIHLKGSGPTVFSRGGDGLAALGPMLREYLVSEAMAAMGIATTRSLAVIATGESVRREQLLPGAILTRVAQSHIRVGTFVFAAENRESLRELADYTIARHFPDLDKGDYFGFLEQVIVRQASLISDWLMVGFVHGVMNTDNMAISGETIDYGPCAFMEAYDPGTVFSSIDRQGRYAYGNQARIAQWNLARFAESLLPLLDDRTEKAIERANTALMTFESFHNSAMNQKMCAKLGLIHVDDDTDTLITELLAVMHADKLDFTTTFRALCDREFCEVLKYERTSGLRDWQQKWASRLGAGADRLKQNPAYIPRNHLVEEALQAAKDGDFAPFETLVDIVRHPFELQNVDLRYLMPAREDERVIQTFCGT
jgi:uncharacterized protein YdiU (UPF0061 family)